VVWKVPVALDQEQEVKDAGKPVLPETTSSADGFRDGPREQAKFSFPRQLCGDGLGRIFVQDQTGPRQAPVVRELDLSGRVSTIGGHHEDTSQRSRADGVGTLAGFNAPAGITVAPSGAIYVADNGNRCLRRIAPDGKVTVVAGTTVDATGTAEDDSQNPQAARFGSLGFLGVDYPGRLLAMEPSAGRLRCLDFKKYAANRETLLSEKEGVSTAGENLRSTLVCIFPASASPRGKYAFVLADPLDTEGHHQIKVLRPPSSDATEIVEPSVRVQAMCADRLNRIWVALPPDPALPGLLQLYRYAYPVPRTGKTWVRTSGPNPAGLRFHPAGSSQTLHGRPYALCAEPRITAMATDSHNNLFLTDAENGCLWKVDEAMTTIGLVAGSYPFLGPPGPHLHSPLPAMQGLAVTPDDDLVVTCGNAVLQITPYPCAQTPLPWLEAPYLIPDAAVKLKVSAASSSAKVQRTTLSCAKQEQLWQMAIAKSTSRQANAWTTLQAVKAEKLHADQAFQAVPSSLPLRNKANDLRVVLTQALQSMAVATAEGEAKLSAYALLLLREPLEKQGIPEKGIQEETGVEEAVSMARQARFEYLLVAGHRDHLKEGSPSWAAAGFRQSYLQSLQEAKQAKAEHLSQQRVEKALKRADPAFVAAQAQTVLAKAASDEKAKAFQKLEAEAKAFDEKSLREPVAGFRPWTTPGNPPPA
jgi:hypothetical protein